MTKLRPWKCFYIAIDKSLKILGAESKNTSLNLKLIEQAYRIFKPGKGRPSVIVTFLFKVWNRCEKDCSSNYNRQVHLANFVLWNVRKHFHVKPPQQEKSMNQMTGGTMKENWSLGRIKSCAVRLFIGLDFRQYNNGGGYQELNSRVC